MGKISFKSIFKAVVTAAAVAAVVYALPFVPLPAGVSYAAAVTTAAVMTAATATVSQLLAETPKGFDLGEQLRGQLVSTRQPAGDAFIVYGETRVGGTIVHMETTGAKNETMYLAIAMAGHEIQSIQKIYVNDEEFSLTTSGNIYTIDYKGSTSVLNFDYLLGTSTQSAMELFLTTTAENFAFKGIATLGVKAVFDQDKFPQGLPNFSAKIRGRKVFDPRTDTTAYSQNAALCIRDYLTNTEFGLGATSAEIDDASFEIAADICDENVSLAAGGTEKRYTVNGAFSSGEQPKEILSKMLTACGGQLAYVGGKWVLRVAAYRSPSLTLTDDDIVGEITVQGSQSRRDIFNAVKGVYSEPQTLYQLNSFPPQTNSTYETEDGERIWKDIQFPFTTSAPTCQRLAKIDLEKARQQISVTMSCKLTAFALQPGDTVNLTIPRYGWSAKVFEVVNWEFEFVNSETGSVPLVNLTLRETASGVYDWNSGMETTVDIAPNTNLPDPFTVTAPGISISDVLEAFAEEVFTKLVVNVTGDNTFQNRYEVQAKISTSSDWINLGQASGNIFELYNVGDGVLYDVRARSINGLGVRSDWTTGQHYVVGKTTPPSNVTNFSVNIIGTEAHLTWTPITDLDLSHYRIRHSRLTSGATYTDAIDLLPKVSRPATTATAPAMTGTYFIKAVDKLGLESLSATETVAIIEDIKGLNAVQTVTEHPAFTGSKNEVSVIDNQLILDTASNFDDVSGNFDDVDGDFDGGGGTTSTYGTYDFATVVDLGSVYTSRVTAIVETGRIDYANTFDSADGLFDDKEGLFDGDTTNVGDVNVELQISTTTDNPSGGATWTDYRKFFVGDYKARGLRFRCVLTSLDENSSPSVSYLQVTVDMPDRIASGADISSGTSAGGKVVNFTPAFKAVPAIGIAAQNLAQGDYYTITSKSASSFTIKFLNSSGTVVDRTFDYVAQGYGELAA